MRLLRLDPGSMCISGSGMLFFPAQRGNIPSDHDRRVLLSQCMACFLPLSHMVNEKRENMMFMTDEASNSPWAWNIIDVRSTRS
jgi:hypothetical protein